MVLGDQPTRSRTKSGQQHRSPGAQPRHYTDLAVTFWSPAVFRAFYAPEVVATNVAPTINTGATFRSANDLDLTNPDAQETSVVLQTHPTAGEQISDGCHRLSAATGARADCQDEITQ
jgi:hypothetical protein